MTEFTARAATVLVNEDVQFDLDTLDTFVRATYPDLRKCLNKLQANSIDGKLNAIANIGNSDDEMLIQATQLFKQKKIIDGRKKLIEYVNMNPTRTEDIYRWMYDNLDLWGDSAEAKDAAIIIIRNGMVNLPSMAIPEIGLSATLIELTS